MPRSKNWKEGLMKDKWEWCAPDAATLERDQEIIAAAKVRDQMKALEIDTAYLDAYIEHLEGER